MKLFYAQYTPGNDAQHCSPGNITITLTYTCAFGCQNQLLIHTHTVPKNMHSNAEQRMNGILFSHQEKTEYSCMELSTKIAVADVAENTKPVYHKKKKK